MTKKDIEYFKKKLEDRKLQIEANLEDRVTNVKNLIEDDANDDGDLAFVSSDSFTGNVIAKQQESELEEIMYALNRIQDGTYGICEMCEDEIGVQRLEVKPFAKYCIDCREIIENSPKLKRS